MGTERCQVLKGTEPSGWQSQGDVHPEPRPCHRLLSSHFQYETVLMSKIKDPALTLKKYILQLVKYHTIRRGSGSPVRTCSRTPPPPESRYSRPQSLQNILMGHKAVFSSLIPPCTVRFPLLFLSLASEFQKTQFRWSLV